MTIFLWSRDSRDRPGARAKVSLGKGMEGLGNSKVPLGKDRRVSATPKRLSARDWRVSASPKSLFAIGGFRQGVDGSRQVQGGRVNPD